MTRLRGFFLASSTLAAIAAAVACNDDADVATWTDPNTADAAIEASLPHVGDDAAADADAGATDAAVDSARPPIQRPPFESTDVPVTCTDDPCAVQLVAGDSHFCARLNDGTVKCWGDNWNGQVGTGTTDRSDGYGPTTVAGLTGVKQLSAAEYATCAVLADDTIKCWGGNRQGQLGLQASPGKSDYSQHATPTAVAFTQTVTRVDVGVRTVCAIPTTGGLVCWGGNDKLQTTRPDAGTVGGPGTATVTPFTLARTSGTTTSVFGLTDTDEIVSWGEVSGRESSINPNAAPNAIATLSKVTSFASGAGHTCAIADGELYCWGDGANGALGSGLPNDERFPTHAPIVNDAKLTSYPQQVVASSNRTCVRVTDGTVQCTGNNMYGAVGDGQSGSATPFLTKATIYTGYAVQVATSTNSTCALDKNGKVMCWGGNGYGELGQATTDYDPHTAAVNVTF